MKDIRKTSESIRSIRKTQPFFPTTLQAMSCIVIARLSHIPGYIHLKAVYPERKQEEKEEEEEEEEEEVDESSSFMECVHAHANAERTRNNSHSAIISDRIISACTTSIPVRICI